jgi:hypothetical protein
MVLSSFTISYEKGLKKENFKPFSPRLGWAQGYSSGFVKVVDLTNIPDEIFYLVGECCYCRKWERDGSAYADGNSVRLFLMTFYL